MAMSHECKERLVAFITITLILMAILGVVWDMRLNQISFYNSYGLEAEE